MRVILNTLVLVDGNEVLNGSHVSLLSPQHLLRDHTDQIPSV